VEQAPTNKTVVTHFTSIAYPADAASRLVEGIVVVRAYLDEAGKVLRAEAVSGAAPLLSETLDDIRQWRFQPSDSRIAVVVINFKISPVSCETTSDQFVFEENNFVTVTTCWPPPTQVNVSPRTQQKDKADHNDTVVMKFAELQYPAASRAARIQGVVVLQVDLDNAGKVIAVNPITAPPLLASEAAANVRNWRFRPSAHKKAVIVYDFRISDGACRPEKGYFTFTEDNLATILGCSVEMEPSTSNTN
jgi:TonB family protein